jgi:hypothetical protein
MRAKKESIKMSDLMTSQRRRKLNTLITITKDEVPYLDLRAVYRLIEKTPSGNKCRYLERSVDVFPIENIFGDVLLLCPEGDRTDGKVHLEISSRDNKIITVNPDFKGLAYSLSQTYRQKTKFIFEVT